MTMLAKTPLQAQLTDGVAARISHVSHAFAASDGSSIPALRDINLTIGAQEFVSIVGPSGCGKSTLLRILAGLVTPASGEVSVLGKPVGARRRDVSLVFQRPALLPWLNILDNILFPLRHMSRPVGREEAERAMALLAMMGMADFAKLRPRELSGGMQQRVSICRALITDPLLLLMDEPFAALDAQTREILQEELLALMQRPDERKTMVFITHSIDEAIVLGDRITVMSARPGRVKETLDMPFGWPRDVDAVRADPRFAEIRLHIWRQLHTAGARQANAPREVA
jgi:NitT/TauT family transport system ATP-binding protein